MSHAFSPQRTVRWGKYILADDTLRAMCRSQRGPARLLSVGELRAQFPTAARAVVVDDAISLPESHFDAWSTARGWYRLALPARQLPPTSVLVIPRGRVVGRTGTIHVPAADACLQEFESPPRDTKGFRRHLPFGRLNPRFWKHAALALGRERFVPVVRRCPGRVAVLNASGSHNFFHWMTEVLPRLQTLLKSGAQADWFVVDGYARWQQESLTALGVPSERVIQPHATLHLEADELLVPSLNPVQAIQPMADTLAQRLGVGKRGSSTRTIFIERRRSRLPGNAAEFSAWRQQLGFADHHLEALPLASQIAKFREASVVLAAHGAGLSHTIHCRPGTIVIELMPQGVNRPCYSHLSRVCRLRHVVIEAPRRGWHQNMTIPLDTIDQALATAARGRSG
jgi:hypothetical protein